LLAAFIIIVCFVCASAVWFDIGVMVLMCTCVV